MPAESKLEQFLHIDVHAHARDTVHKGEPFQLFRHALPTDLLAPVSRLDAAGLLADGDHDLIAEMHALDPEGTAWLLRDMLARGERR